MEQAASGQAPWPSGPRLVLIVLAQAMNVALVVGGIVFVVEVAYRLRDLPSVYRGPVDGDVVRGFGIGILAGLTIAAVASVALVAMAFRLRAGAAIDVLLWAGLWWPLTVAVSILTPAYSSAISFAVCGLGVLVGAGGFWAISGMRTLGMTEPLDRPRDARKDQ